MLEEDKELYPALDSPGKTVSTVVSPVFNDLSITNGIESKFAENK